MNEPYSTEPVTKMDEVFPQHTNAYNTLFGGRLLSIMDTAAGMVSSKFAHREFVTISIDALKFKRPAFQGDLIETTAKVANGFKLISGSHSSGFGGLALNNQANECLLDGQPGSTLSLIHI